MAERDFSDYDVIGDTPQLHPYPIDRDGWNAPCSLCGRKLGLHSIFPNAFGRWALCADLSQLPEDDRLADVGAAEWLKEPA